MPSLPNPSSPSPCFFAAVLAVVSDHPKSILSPLDDLLIEVHWGFLAALHLFRSLGQHCLSLIIHLPLLVIFLYGYHHPRYLWFHRNRQTQIRYQIQVAGLNDVGANTNSLDNAWNWDLVGVGMRNYLSNQELEGETKSCISRQSRNALSQLDKIRPHSPHNLLFTLIRFEFWSYITATCKSE